MFETENMFAALLQQCKGVPAMKAWLNQDNMLIDIRVNERDWKRKRGRKQTSIHLYCC